MRQIRNLELLFGVEMSKSCFCVATWVYANKMVTNDLYCRTLKSFFSADVFLFRCFTRLVNIYFFAVACSCFTVCNSFKDNRRLTYYNSMIVRQMKQQLGNEEKRLAVILTITGTTKYMCIRITVVRAILFLRYFKWLRSCNCLACTLYHRQAVKKISKCTQTIKSIQS